MHFYCHLSNLLENQREYHRVHFPDVSIIFQFHSKFGEFREWLKNRQLLFLANQYPRQPEQKNATYRGYQEKLPGFQDRDIENRWKAIHTFELIHYPIYLRFLRVGECFFLCFFLLCP